MMAWLDALGRPDVPDFRVLSGEGAAAPERNRSTRSERYSFSTRGRERVGSVWSDGCWRISSASLFQARGLTPFSSHPFPLFNIIQSYTPSSSSPAFFIAVANSSFKKS